MPDFENRTPAGSDKFRSESAQLYQLLGESPNADTDTIKRAVQRELEKVHCASEQGDESALERRAQILRAATVLGPDHRRAYDAFMQTHPDRDVLIINVPPPGSSAQTMDAAIDALMPSLMEALRKPPPRIGGRPAGLQNVTEAQQEMWDALGDIAADAADPQPIFQTTVRNALVEYGVIDPTEAAGVVVGPKRGFAETLRLVARMCRGSDYGDAPELRLRAALARDAARALGIEQKPLRREMWEAVEDFPDSPGDPTPVFQNSLKSRLSDLGLPIAEAPESIRIDPLNAPDAVKAAIDFLNITRKTLRDGRIPYDEAVAKSQALGRALLPKLNLTLLTPETNKSSEDLQMAAVDYAWAGGSPGFQEAKMAFEQALRAKLQAQNKPTEGAEFERAAKEILEPINEQFKRYKNYRRAAYPPEASD